MERAAGNEMPTLGTKLQVPADHVDNVERGAHTFFQVEVCG